MVMLPTFLSLGSPDPLSILAAFLISTEAGGVFNTKVKLRSCGKARNRQELLHDTGLCPMCSHGSKASGLTGWVLTSCFQVVWGATTLLEPPGYTILHSFPESLHSLRHLIAEHRISRCFACQNAYLIHCDLHGDDRPHLVLRGCVVLLAESHDVHTLQVAKPVGLLEAWFRAGGCGVS